MCVLVGMGRAFSVTKEKVFFMNSILGDFHYYDVLCIFHIYYVICIFLQILKIFIVYFFIFHSKSSLNKYSYNLVFPQLPFCISCIFICSSILSFYLPFFLFFSMEFRICGHLDKFLFKESNGHFYILIYLYLNSKSFLMFTT